MHFFEKKIICTASQAMLLMLQFVKRVPYLQLNNLVNKVARNWIRHYLLFSSSLIFKTDLDKDLFTNSQKVRLEGLSKSSLTLILILLIDWS